MKIIRNNLIPFNGYKAINLFGILFVRKKAIITDTLINHEEIHTAQMREVLYIPYYIWYALEWFIKLFSYWDAHEAYKNIGFEREAHFYAKDMDYLKNRKHFAWFHLIWSQP